MNIYRIPLNIVLVSMLFLSEYISPITLCSFCILSSLFPVLGSSYLLYSKKTKKSKIDADKKSENELENENDISDNNIERI